MTGPPGSGERRHRYVLRAVMWAFAPFVDSWDGLSLNRFLSVMFALTAVHGRLVHDAAVTGWDCTMAATAGALAFGKDVFIAFLEHRNQKESGG